MPKSFGGIERVEERPQTPRGDLFHPFIVVPHMASRTSLSSSSPTSETKKQHTGSLSAQHRFTISLI